MLAAADIGASVTFAQTAYDHASLNLAVYSGVNATTPITTFTNALDTAKSTHTTADVRRCRPDRSWFRSGVTARRRLAPGRCPAA